MPLPQRDIEILPRLQRLHLSEAARPSLPKCECPRPDPRHLPHCKPPAPSADAGDTAPPSLRTSRNRTAAAGPAHLRAAGDAPTTPRSAGRPVSDPTVRPRPPPNTQRGRHAVLGVRCHEVPVRTVVCRWATSHRLRPSRPARSTNAAGPPPAAARHYAGPPHARPPRGFGVAPQRPHPPLKTRLRIPRRAHRRKPRGLQPPPSRLCAPETRFFERLRKHPRTRLQQQRAIAMPSGVTIRPRLNGDRCSTHRVSVVEGVTSREGRFLMRFVSCSTPRYQARPRPVSPAPQIQQPTDTL
jgi:hypothetical protein